MTLSDRKGILLAVAGLAAGVAVFLGVTGPEIDEEAESSLRRVGGVCLELERWTLLGWSTVGQTHSVRDMQSSTWLPPVDDPPCAQVPERNYLVRVFGQPPGVYRMCGLADDNVCVQFRRVAP